MLKVLRSHSIICTVSVWLLLIVLPVVALAEGESGVESKFSIALSSGLSPILSGSAGEGKGAPDYKDLYRAGYGLSLEAEYRVCEYASLVGGVGYEEYPGRSFQGLDFDDLEVIPVYVGGKFHPPLNSLVKPYILAHVGGARFSAVEVSWNSLSANYWDASWVFLGDLGVGFDFTVNNWSFSSNIKLRYQGAPDNNLKAADADASWSIPINFGISYSF